MYFNDEDQYLKLLKGMRDGVKLDGFDRDDRTRVGTYSVFGRQMRFDLSKSFPLFTHKQVFMRGIFEELMWFLRGDTNIKTLLEKDVHIWSQWRYKDYINTTFKEAIENKWAFAPPTLSKFEDMILKCPEFAAKWGNIGKGYGHQWRNFGGSHETWFNANEGEGFDQIAWLINEIKTNPMSRRLIVSGWNPHEIDEVDLPPCHTLFQMFVNDGKLSCQLYQRSADLLLGVPFNIASYALLTHLIALECGLDVGEFVWVGGDCHVYSDQIDGLSEIVDNRVSLPPPKILINKKESILDYEWEDVTILGYKHQGKISMPVAV